MLLPVAREARPVRYSDRYRQFSITQSSTASRYSPGRCSRYKLWNSRCALSCNWCSSSRASWLWPPCL